MVLFNYCEYWGNEHELQVCQKQELGSFEYLSRSILVRSYNNSIFIFENLCADL